MSWQTERTSPGGEDADEAAMLAVQAGDHAAFSRLVQRWERPIRRLCIHMACDEHLGEDLAQEVFARLFMKRQHFEPGRKFSTWLWRLALNVCFGESRRGRQEVSDEEGMARVACGRELAPDEGVAAQERAEQVRGALRQLGDGNRAVLVLREYEGLKYREIAELLEIPEGTVKWRMAEALTHLTQELRQLAPGGAQLRIEAKR